MAPAFQFKGTDPVPVSFAPSKTSRIALPISWISKGLPIIALMPIALTVSGLKPSASPVHKITGTLEFSFRISRIRRAVGASPGVWWPR